MLFWRCLQVGVLSGEGLRGSSVRAAVGAVGVDARQIYGHVDNGVKQDCCYSNAKETVVVEALVRGVHQPQEPLKECERMTQLHLPAINNAQCPTDHPQEVSIAIMSRGSPVLDDHGVSINMQC